MTGTWPLTAMLFVPAGDPRKVAKVPSLEAPAVILDLEDAVAVSAKGDARVMAARVITAERCRRQLWVRINGIETGLSGTDLDAVVVEGIAGVVVPKVGAVGDVRKVARLIGKIERRRGLPFGGIGIIPTIESVAGLVNAREIAAAERVQCLGFGAGDFSLELGLDWPSAAPSSNPTLLAAKAELVLASRYAGLAPPHDSAFPNFGDVEGLRREARLARTMGFGGKHVIHPAQVPVVLDEFRPDADAVERARKVIQAFDEAESRGLANVQVDGQLVDYPVVARARQLVTVAEAYDS